MLEILLYILLYVVTFIINRMMYLYLQKLDECWYPNPVAILMCFMSLLGTIVLGTILLLELLESGFKSSFIGKIFKYTPKNKEQDNDKRGWDEC